MIPPNASSMLIPVGALSPHPLNEQIYEDDPEDPKLIASVASLGIVEPLLVEEYRPGELEDGSYQILSGHRR